MSRRDASTTATLDTPTYQGSAYALRAARSSLASAAHYRLMGNAFMSRVCLASAMGYRRVAARALVLEQYKIILSPSDIEWESTQVPMSWRDHVDPASREREVRVERARLAWRTGLSGRHV